MSIQVSGKPQAPLVPTANDSLVVTVLARCEELRVAFDANDVTRFQTILSGLPLFGQVHAWTAFGCDAASYNKPEILALLIPYEAKALADDDRYMPGKLLACVCDSNSPAVCDVLIDTGIDINVPDAFTGSGLLMNCIEENHIELTTHLLSPAVMAKTNVRLDEALYKTRWPSLVAARSVEMIRLLLDHGAKLEGSSALHVAAERGDLLKMRALLQLGADVNENLRLDWSKPESFWLNIKRESLGTSLHYAVDGWSLDEAELLMASGADPKARDVLGRTPLERLVGHHIKYREYWGLKELLS